MSETTIQKGRRLAKAGRVRALTGPVYLVQGDTGEYAVFVEGATYCTCPAPGPCSHMQAAVEVAASTALEDTWRRAESALAELGRAYGEDSDTLTEALDAFDRARGEI